MKLKVLGLILLFTANLFALSQKKVEHNVKKYIEKKTHSKVEKIETISTYEVGGTDGWHVYFLSLDIKMKMGKVYRKRHLSQTVFAKGNRLTFSLKDKKGREYSRILKPIVPKEAYNKRHLLVGDENAQHKILLISDPFCPFCQKIVPPLITDIQRHPNIFALYSYQLPLVRIHPASKVVTKAMVILHEEGKIEDYKKMYHLPISEKERRESVILNAIEKKIGRRFTHKELMNPKVKEVLDFDMEIKRRLFVTGTPTIFIDGIWDPTRFAYKRYLQEVKIEEKKVTPKKEKGFFASLFD